MTGFNQMNTPGKDMGPEIPNLPMDRQTPVKPLPSRNCKGTGFSSSSSESLAFYVQSPVGKFTPV